jgi:hypothetical protein
MAAQTWVLTDVEQGIYTDDFALSSDELGLEPGSWSFSKRRLRGGRSDGVDEVRVQQGDFSFSVLPTRGMSVWKAWLGDWEVGWKSPVRGPVHPRFVPVAEPSGLGWLDGFDELLVRCGLESNGAPEFEDNGRLRYSLHGRIANTPAHRVEVRIDSDSGDISVTGLMEESRFLFHHWRLTSTITARRGETRFRVRDEVENLSGRDGEMQLLYHINLGAPLLEEASEVIVAAKTVAPKDHRAAQDIATWSQFAAPQAGYAEQVYFFDMATDAAHNAAALLKDARGSRGVTVRYNTQKLPHFILWKNTGALPDGYVAGLEPSTNFPNTRTFEGKHGRVVKLPPGGKAVFEVQVDVHGDAVAVQNAEAVVRNLQPNSPTVLTTPHKDWSPG